MDELARAADRARHKGTQARDIQAAAENQVRF